MQAVAHTRSFVYVCMYVFFFGVGFVFEGDAYWNGVGCEGGGGGGGGGGQTWEKGCFYDIGFALYVVLQYTPGLATCVCLFFFLSSHGSNWLLLRNYEFFFAWPRDIFPIPPLVIWL